MNIQNIEEENHNNDSLFLDLNKAFYLKLCNKAFIFN